MLCTSAALLSQPEETPQELSELLPGIHVTDGIVEFGGQIAIDVHHPDTPDVYLEMFITAPDSREHESLIVTDIKPSNLHAALLAAGFESGAPLTRGEDGKQVPAHGDSLIIEVAEDQDDPEFMAITGWVMHVEQESGIVDDERWSGFVFAGSRLTRRGYEADGAGTIASLTSFGNEVIAPTWTISHLAEIDEPVWIAHRDRIPTKEIGRAS
ncbi:MAG: YdjY domain-containing protein, partial [Phycisphaerales bacterium]